MAWNYGVIHHDWIDTWKKEYWSEDHQYKSKCKAEPLKELFIPGSLRVFLAWLAVIVRDLALIEVVEGVVEFEPLEQVEAGDGHCPVDDHFHLPQERHRLVDAEGPHGEEPGVADERRLEGGLGVPVSQLEGRQGEVVEPDQVVEDQGEPFRGVKEGEGVTWQDHAELVMHVDY